MSHIPVLLNEVVEYLNPGQGVKKFIDGTAGAGGHIRAILSANKDAKVLGIDWDQASLEKLQKAFVQEGLEPRTILVSGNYKDLAQIAKDHKFAPVDGILIDLGFSSMQIDDPERGFSFQTEGPLDMRYSPSHNVTAEKVLNKYTLDRLTEVFKEYGEERFARSIASKILKARGLGTIRTTGQLARIVVDALPGHVRFKSTDSLRRIFQALRIEVNGELENLKSVLPSAMQTLKSGGRLVIISFHSLEDRIVKEFFAAEAKDCICPPEFPTCICGKSSTARILTRKPITASAEELNRNSRSAPAKLRALEKI